MPFEDNSIDAISMESSLELFPADTDSLFIKECCRILKVNGKVIILPLYMHKDYINCFGKSFYKSARKELDAIKEVRFDYNVPFTRLYNAVQLKRRVLSSIRGDDMKVNLYIVESSDICLQDKKDSFIYLRYVLVLEKKNLQ